MAPIGERSPGRHARYGGVLYGYLSCSKASVVADMDQDGDVQMVHGLLASADAIVWSSESVLCGHPALSIDAIQSASPRAAVLALTPFGLSSPWVGRPANEFVLQAMSGSAWNHGSPDDTPILFGGSHADYAIGTVGALSLLIARERQALTASGELIDVAGLEVLQLTHTMFPITFFDLAKRPYRARRYDSIPGVHRTTDGWVGLWVTTGQQWLDFCSMIERTDWLEDASLGLMDNRAMRHDELVGVIDEWASTRTTDEVVEFAALLRIPVAPIGNGATLPTFDHFTDRGAFTTHPRSGAVQPTAWYRMSDGPGACPPSPSPALGEDTDEYRVEATAADRGGDLVDSKPSGDGAQPFEGLRILDMTAYWAGPIIPHVFAMLGADVIHVESAKRPDGIRMAATIPMSEPGWWETSPFFNGTNTCKRDIALNLQSTEGRATFLRLVAESDVVIENFSPRVLDQLGLDFETLKSHRSDIIVLRAPAFGTSGPWRDRVGYAPTIDQASGLSWTTGTTDGPPSVIGGATDAVGGLHGTIALLFALEHRRRTGSGMLIESAQVDAALQIAGEQVAEYSINDALLDRCGNRSWTCVPQGVYRVLDRDRSDQGVPDDDWIALSIETDPQWEALAAIIDEPKLRADDTLRSVAGRREAHDAIDAAIASWCRSRTADEAVAELIAAGVPAAPVVPPHELAGIETLVARKFYETVDQPVAGRMRVPGFPARFSGGPERWIRAAAPCLGEHNREVLAEVAGCTSEEIDELERLEIIGNKAELFLGW